MVAMSTPLTFAWTGERRSRPPKDSTVPMPLTPEDTGGRLHFRSLDDVAETSCRPGATQQPAPQLAIMIGETGMVGRQRQPRDYVRAPRPMAQIMG